MCACRVCRRPAPPSTSGADCGKNVPFLTPPLAPSTPLTSHRFHHNNPIHTHSTPDSTLSKKAGLAHSKTDGQQTISSIHLKIKKNFSFFSANNETKILPFVSSPSIFPVIFPIALKKNKIIKFEARNQLNNKTKAEKKKKKPQIPKKGKPNNNNKGVTKTLQNTFEGIGIIHPKMKMLSSSTHLHVITNIYLFLLLDIKDILNNVDNQTVSVPFDFYCIFVNAIKVNGNRLVNKILQNIFFSVLHKNEIQVRNNKRQFFIFELSL